MYREQLHLTGHKDSSLNIWHCSGNNKDLQWKNISVEGKQFMEFHCVCTQLKFSISD